MNDSPQQGEAELSRRRAAFSSFLDERLPVLADLAEALGLAEPTSIVVEPDRYLPAIDAFMRDQVVTGEDRAWIVTRLGYLIGEVLVQRLGGCWLVADVPGSRHFARCVVGRFAAIRNPQALVDPFEVASALVDAPAGRSLLDLVSEVERELRAA